MAPEVIEQAFEPFYTTKGSGRGTGLGLSQVYGFVKQSGGHVKIYSEPARARRSRSTCRAMTARTRRRGLPNKPRRRFRAGRADEIILLVEDEPGVRHTSAELIPSWAIRLCWPRLGPTPSNCSNAIRRCALLFTDVVMPRMDGPQLAQKAMQRRPDLKVLFTTGYTRNAVVHNGLLDRDVALLSKPFTLEQLARKLRAVIDGPG